MIRGFDSYTVTPPRQRVVARTVMTCSACGRPQLVRTVDTGEEAYLDPGACPDCGSEWEDEEAE